MSLNLPWSVEQDFVKYIADANGETIYLDDHRDGVLLETIVTAVNSLPDLLAVCEAVIEEFGKSCDCTDAGLYDCIVGKAREVIAAAKGEDG